MNTELARRYATLLNKKKALESELGAVKTEIGQAEAVLLQEFDDEGVTQFRIEDEDGRRVTLYRHSQLWANRNPDVSVEDFHAALRACGLDDMVQERVNVQTLSAVVREYDQNGCELPEQLAAVITSGHRNALRGRA